MRYRLTAAAKRDLSEIWWYIAQDSESAADRFAEAVRARCELLGRSPHAGRRRDDLGAGLRSIPFGEYLIVYRVGRPGIQVKRVVHGRRDLLRLLN